MSKDPFLDPAKPPPDKALGTRMGEAFKMVQTAVEACDTGRARISFTWKFSKTSGWHVTFDRGSKRSFYLFPKPGDFLLRMVFSEKGVAALRAAHGLAPAVSAQLANPKKYPEGTLVELTKVSANVVALTTLLRIKLTT
jgi:Protein of unknown function (DUF3788)